MSNIENLKPAPEEENILDVAWANESAQWKERERDFYEKERRSLEILKKIDERLGNLLEKNTKAGFSYYREKWWLEYEKWCAEHKARNEVYDQWWSDYDKANTCNEYNIWFYGYNKWYADYEKWFKEYEAWWDRYSAWSTKITPLEKKPKKKYAIFQSFSAPAAAFGFVLAGAYLGIVAFYLGAGAARVRS